MAPTPPKRPSLGVVTYWLLAQPLAPSTIVSSSRTSVVLMAPKSEAAFTNIDSWVNFGLLQLSSNLPSCSKRLALPGPRSRYATSLASWDAPTMAEETAK